jgi:hypothetical protein
MIRRYVIGYITSHRYWVQTVQSHYNKKKYIFENWFETCLFSKPKKWTRFIAVIKSGDLAA